MTVYKKMERFSCRQHINKVFCRNLTEPYRIFIFDRELVSGYSFTCLPRKLLINIAQ